MTRGLRWILLCEDSDHEAFFRKHVLEPLFGRPFRVLKVGSAANVVDAFPENVRYVRQRPGEGVGLVTVVDGDRFGVRTRREQLDAALAKRDMEAISASDRVAVCVPTWSIETWALWLTNMRSLNEGTPYKQSAVFRSAGISLKDASKCWKELDVNDKDILPSLADARAELARLVAIS